jgi:hypothetical protein
MLRSKPAETGQTAENGTFELTDDVSLFPSYRKPFDAMPIAVIAIAWAVR